MIEGSITKEEFRKVYMSLVSVYVAVLFDGEFLVDCCFAGDSLRYEQNLSLKFFVLLGKGDLLLPFLFDADLFLCFYSICLYTSW